MNAPFDTVRTFAEASILVVAIWAGVLFLRAKAPQSKLFQSVQQYALVATAIAVVVAQLSVAHVRPSRETFCKLNIKTLAESIAQYQTDADGYFPQAATWQTDISRYQNNRKELEHLTCKLHGTQTGYGFNPYLPLNGEMPDAAHTIMIAETFKTGKNLLLRSEKDLATRHNRPIVAFANGKTEFVQPSSRIFLSKEKGAVRFPTSRFDPKEREYAISEFIEWVVVPFSGYAIFLAGFAYFVYAKNGESPERRRLRFLVITLWIISGLAILIAYPVFVSASASMR